MSEPYATCNGQRLTAITLNVANVGPWIAELDFETAPDVAGKVEIKLGALTLVGTVLPMYDGTYIEQRRCRVVGGGGGWGRTVTRKNYHNDAGVKSRLVADDVARECGETIGDFAPEIERIGHDYVRSVGTGSRVLEHVIGARPWWVDYAGVTHVGMRPSVPLTIDGTYDVVAFDPRNRTLTFAIDDIARVQIGSVVSQAPLESAQTIREFDIQIDADTALVVAWCGGSETERGRLAGLLRTIAQRATDAPLWGKYRYRVVAMRGDGRVDLQAVRKAAGLPDVQPLSVWPGVAGADAELSAGAEVLVEFIEGDPTQPIVTHFAGVDGKGFLPVSLAFCGGVQAVARQGDLVQSGGVGTSCVFMAIPPPPIPTPTPLVTGTPYLVSFSTSAADLPLLAKPLYGAIATGSPKVRA